jgi:hypothetical protein
MPIFIPLEIDDTDTVLHTAAAMSDLNLPWLFLPPLFLTDNNNDFSGCSWLYSSKLAPVMLRLPGEVGLYD